uniref:CD3 gamma/delta subunit Ig-like domain-containing protein n=2 Tax=Xiphophorus maculatus TaxID=8083 RepID=M3ZL37_XIPMA
MAVQVVFAVIFMFATSVKAETVKGGATFWNKEVTLTCPLTGSVTWHKEKSKNPETSTSTKNVPKEFTFTYERQVQYRCQYEIAGPPPESTVNYYFYVKGKACKNCFELDPKIFLGIIVANVIWTAVVMMIIYRCSKKKSSDGPSSSIKPTPRAGHRAPHGPSADYETLNPNTRSQDTYSTVVNSGMVNRTG